MSTIFTPGRTIIVAGNLFYSIGAFAADWSNTHVFNPSWPPHARFHNGQTMSLGVCLATASIYSAFKPALTASKASAQESIFDAAVVGSFYCLAGLSAILYPGTAWVDPEFGDPPAQAYVFAGIVVAMWVGYWLEIRRIAKLKKG